MNHGLISDPQFVADRLQKAHIVSVTFLPEGYENITLPTDKTCYYACASKPTVRDGEGNVVIYTIPELCVFIEPCGDDEWRVYIRNSNLFGEIKTHAWVIPWQLGAK